jgi:hypothetical protein
MRFVTVFLIMSLVSTAEDPNYLMKDITYSKDLGCGECVAGGYSFCWKSTSSGEVLSDKEYPKYNSNSNLRTAICCKDNKDASNCYGVKLGSKSVTKNWICSGSYT